MNGEQYTVKETLSLFVLPALQRIEFSLSEKASAAQVEKINARVETLEKTALTEDSERKGRRVVGAAMFAVSASLLIPAAQIIVAVIK